MVGAVLAGGGAVIGVVLLMVLAPFMFAGLWLGNRWHARVSQRHMSRLVSVLLMLIGLSLLARVAR